MATSFPSQSRARATSLSLQEAHELQDRAPLRDSVDSDKSFEEDVEVEQGHVRSSSQRNFEAPKAREGLAMLASVVLVLVMALAAGLTTVYDWVM